eukprot:217963_1
MMWLYDSDHDHDTAWEITESHSLLQPLQKSEAAKKYQDEYDQYTQKQFNAWKSAVWKLLNHCVDHDLFTLISIYCETSVANYYQINTRYDDYDDNSNSYRYDGGEWVQDVLHSTIPQCLKGKVQFGDVVEVPGFRGSGVYVVSNVNNGKLLRVGHHGSGQIDIPVEITDQLCDPIEFYRFYAPVQGLSYQEYMSFSFNHSYIQKIFGLHSSNKTCFNASSHSNWRFYINEQMTMCFGDPPPPIQSHPHSFTYNVAYEPRVLYVVTDIGEITVPLVYAQQREKPLYYYLKKVYNKRIEADNFKQRLQIVGDDKATKLPPRVRTHMFLIHALIEDDINECNEFDVELNKPVSWNISYPSVPSATFVGLGCELKQMKEFIERASYIHLCYGIKIMADHHGHGDRLISFCDLNSLISPPILGTSWSSWSSGEYSLVPLNNIHIAAAILRGMQLCGDIKCKIVKPIVTLDEYMVFLNSEPSRNLKGYLIHSDAKCFGLVLYLWKYYKIVKDVKLSKLSYDVKLSVEEHKALMSKIRQILN